MGEIMNSPHPLGPTLELIRGGRSERVYELKGSDLHIGRIPGLDVYLDDVRVSRHHARVEHRPDGTSYLVDLDSKGCTKLNGRRLTPFQAAPLRNGSRIRIVDYELIYHDHAVELNDSGEGDSTILESLDNLSTEYLARCSVEPTQALKAILEINRAVGGGAELSEVLNRALEGLMEVFLAAERGFILIVGPEGRPQCALRQQTMGTQLPVLSRTILTQVINEGKAILIKDTAIDPRFHRAKSVVSSFRTAMCVPLLGHNGRSLGMIQLDRRTGRKGFKAGDLDLLAALSVPVGVAVENHQLLKERASWAAAREIQLALLPHARPKIAGYAFWECYRPTLEVGGDLYDYIAAEPSELAKGGPARWAVTVGDVAGKGMAAALVVAGLCPEIRHRCVARRRSGGSPRGSQSPALRPGSWRAVCNHGHGGYRCSVKRHDRGKRRPHGPSGAPSFGHDRGSRPLGSRHATGCVGRGRLSPGRRFPRSGRPRHPLHRRRQRVHESRPSAFRRSAHKGCPGRDKRRSCRGRRGHPGGRSRLFRRPFTVRRHHNRRLRAGRTDLTHSFALSCRESSRPRA